MDQRFFITWKINDSTSGSLIRDFLKEQGISKTALTDIKFKGGEIMVNNQEVNVRYRLNANDVLKVIFPKEQPSDGIKGEEIPLSILYEDQYVLVVNKPAGMSSIPSREHPSGSLANALIGYYDQIGVFATAHIVTRLDRDTSGLVLIAKHRHVHHLLSQQQKQGQVKRKYEAFVLGSIGQEFGKIEQPIARKKDSIIERTVDSEGQYACTNYRVINRYHGFTHLSLQLETGRTHQIRVHMAWLGYPLLGDDLYGGPLKPLTRQALHCREIAFFHPFLEQVCQFTAPLPEDMREILSNNTF